MQNSDIADRLVRNLGLAVPPVALAFTNEIPAGCDVDTTPAPSACAFWRRAEEGLFFAPADSHFNCPVGAMVMGFDLPQPVSAELQNLVGMMTACGYIARSEEHTSELQSLMRISYAVFCLKKKKKPNKVLY